MFCNNNFPFFFLDMVQFEFMLLVFFLWSHFFFYEFLARKECVRMGKISHILIFKEETYNKNLEVSILTLLYKKKKRKEKTKIERWWNYIEQRVMAAQRAVSFVCELGLNNAIFEGDLRLLWMPSTMWSLSLSSIGHLIKDTVSIVGSLVSHSFFQVASQCCSLCFR